MGPEEGTRSRASEEADAPAAAGEGLCRLHNRGLRRRRSGLTQRRGPRPRVAYGAPVGHLIRSSGEPRLAVLGVWGAGAVVIVLALVVAGDVLGGRLAQYARQDISSPGDLGLLSLAVGAGAALLVAVYAMALQPRGRWVAFGLGLLLLIGLRLFAMGRVDAVLTHDPLFIHELAVGVANGQCCFSDRPMGYPIGLGIAYALFGDSRIVTELFNLVVAILTGLLVYDLVRATWGQAAAAVALTVYGVIPSQILLVTVPVTEPMYALALLAAVRLAVASSAGVMATALAGVALGLSQYARPTSIALLPAFMAIPWLAGMRAGQSLVRAAIIVAAFLVVLLPVIEHNLRVHGDLSVATSDYAGWSLYVGTNQQSDGRWNPEDAARLTAFPGDTWWERSEVAGGEGIRRIAEDPGGFASLAVRKFRVLWEEEDYAASHVVGNAEVAPVVQALTSTFYVGLLAAALSGVWRERRAPTRTTLLVLGITATVAAIHIFVEVAGRYHAYLIPLWCVLAGAGIGWLLSLARGRILARGAPGDVLEREP